MTKENQGGSEQPLPEPRSSMREALEKEGRRNGKNGWGNNGGGDAPPGEETAREIQVVREAYRRETAASTCVIPEEPLAMVELVGWYLYSFCSYFITNSAYIVVPCMY